MLDEFGRHATEQETVESVEALAAYTRSPSWLGACFKITDVTDPCSLHVVPLNFSTTSCCLARLRVFAARASRR